MFQFFLGNGNEDFLIIKHMRSVIVRTDALCY